MVVDDLEIIHIMLHSKQNHNSSDNATFSMTGGHRPNSASLDGFDLHQMLRYGEGYSGLNLIEAVIHHRHIVEKTSSVLCKPFIVQISFYQFEVGMHVFYIVVNLNLLGFFFAILFVLLVLFLELSKLI